MKFIDELKIEVRSGHGGPGAVSFRREKFVPRGGPDGGDGGNGGDVIFRVNTRMRSLLDLAHKKRHSAEDGEKGGAQHCSGKTGADLVIDVPPGTLLKNKNGDILF